MLSPEERNKLGEELTLLAVSYGHSFAKETARLYIDSLERYVAGSLSQYMAAISDYIAVPTNKSFPSPMQLRSFVFKKPDSREVATDLVRRIDRAITKHGWSWEQGYYHSDGNYWEANGKSFGSFKEAVIEEVGEVGWHAICSRGGWQNVCRSSNEMDEGQYVAQMRDQIQATISLARQGVDVTQIEMPKKNQELMAPNIAKLLERK